MIYTLDIVIAFIAMATGFSASWVGLELARFAGWRQPAGSLADHSLSSRCIEAALASVIGPRMLLANGYRQWKGGLVSLPLYAALTFVAAGWAMCSGVLVLQLAFASGLFLT